MRSPLAISEFVVVNDESGLVRGEGVDHLFPRLLSGSLRMIRDQNHSLLSR